MYFTSNIIHYHNFYLPRVASSLFFSVLMVLFIFVPIAGATNDNVEDSRDKGNVVFPVGNEKKVSGEKISPEGDSKQRQRTESSLEKKVSSEKIKTTENKEAEDERRIVEEDIVNLQSEMGLKDLIRTISEITSQTFVLDDSIRDKKITIISPKGGFKKRNALRIFETILDLNGFALVSKDGINKVVRKADIKEEAIPTNFGSLKGINPERFITQIIDLENVRADDVASVIQPLISKEGDMVVYPSSNKLIVVDKAENVSRVLRIISDLDAKKVIEVIKIKNAFAPDVAEKLLEIFGERSVVPSHGKTSTARRSETRGRSSRGTKGQASLSGRSDVLGFKVITDERTNSLIVIAFPKDMEKIKKVIKILDVKTEEPEQGIYVVRIKNADAEHIVSVLSGIIGEGRGGVSFSEGSFGGRRRDTRSGEVGFGRGTGTFGISSSGVSSGLGGLSTGRGGISRERGSIGRSSIVIESEGLKVTADPATNAVIIVGSRRNYETIKDVIEKLDVRRKQVFVEAAILEVNLQDLEAFGTNLGLGFTINADTLVFGGQQLPGVPSLLGITADSETSVDLIGTLSGLFLGVVGEEVDPDGSGPIPPIPSFSAIFQALTSITDVNVLSTPSILTTDNEQAEIVVADVIPFPTGSTVGTSGVTVQTIERLPVGIRLAITPQIGEGDYLTLDIVTEVSSTRDAPSGLNTEQFGIATTTRSAESSVVVKNGQTIVIGGLVQDRESVLENKTPLLGDIPFLGNLFKFKQKQTQKLNLIILLTPRIVETDRDVQDLLEDQQRRRNLFEEEVF